MMNPVDENIVIRHESERKTTSFHVSNATREASTIHPRQLKISLTAFAARDNMTTAFRFYTRSLYFPKGQHLKVETD